MDSSPLVQQGIDAYKAGNKEDAIRLFSQAIRERRDDEVAWLYLGASLDDPEKKRKAFQRVLEINPDNEKAKAALARLDPAQPAESAPPVQPVQPVQPIQPLQSPPPGSRPSAGGTAGVNRKLPQLLGDGFALPFHIDGAPAKITQDYLVENALLRLRQAFQIYRNYDTEEAVHTGDGATMWDAVFTAGIGVAAMGVADLVGRWISWILSFFRTGLGGLIWPVFSAIFVIICTGIGFYVGYYLSQVYLEGEQVNISKPKHAMLFASIFLPMTLVAAALSLLNSILSIGIITFLVGIASLANLGYGVILLTEVFDRVYGNQNRRSLIAAGLAVGGWIVGVVITAVILRVFGAIVGFRII